MHVQPLDADFSVADHVDPADLSSLRQQGFRTLICNRQPGEDGFPGAEAFARSASHAGLNWVWLPVTTGEYGPQDVDRFEQALKEQPGPVLGFCRTGRRAIHLWALARARDEGVSVETLMDKARQAGQDPDVIRGLVEKARRKDANG